MSVVRSVIPMRSSMTQSFARAESGHLTYVTILAPKADPDALGPDSPDPDAAQGVLALHNSLRRVGAAHPMLCLCIGVQNTTRVRLASH